MTTHKIAPAPPALTLVVGTEELLADRAVSLVVAGARGMDPQTDVRDISAGDLTFPAIQEFLSPSLFSERRVVVVRGLGMGRAEEVADDDDESAPTSGSLDDRVVAALVAHSKTDEPDVHFVLLHRNANSGRGQLNALKKGKATVTDCKTPTRKGYTDFVAAEFVSLHRPITPDVPEAMVAAAGRDLRALAAACGQLSADYPAKGRLDRQAVESFFAGRVEGDAFAIADAILAGDTGKALVATRQAIAGGATGPAITAALAFNFRNLIKASSAPRAMPLEQAAAEVGLRDWQLRKARQQLTGWSPDAVARALRALAEADANVKGAAVDAEYAIELMIIKLGRARRAG